MARHAPRADECVHGLLTAVIRITGLTLLGSIGAYAGGVVDLGEDYAEVVGSELAR
jgi:hypothetical protein